MPGIAVVGADDERWKNLGVDVDQPLFEGVEVVLQGGHLVAACVLLRVGRVAHLHGGVLHPEIRNQTHPDDVVLPFVLHVEFLHLLTDGRYGIEDRDEYLLTDSGGILDRQRI